MSVEGGLQGFYEDLMRQCREIRWAAEDVERELAAHQATIGEAAVYIAEHLAAAPLLPNLRTRGHELAYALARLAGVEADVEQLIPPNTKGGS